MTSSLYLTPVIVTPDARKHHPELPGVASLRKLQTNPRIHGCDIVARTNTIELLYSYLAGMNDIAYTNAQCMYRMESTEKMKFCVYMANFLPR
jgi:hypothetical protein